VDPRNIVGLLDGGPNSHTGGKGKWGGFASCAVGGKGEDSMRTSQIYLVTVSKQPDVSCRPEVCEANETRCCAATVARPLRFVADDDLVSGHAVVSNQTSRLQ